jgi:hypothetical protein
VLLLTTQVAVGETANESLAGVPAPPPPGTGKPESRQPVRPERDSRSRLRQPRSQTAGADSRTVVRKPKLAIISSTVQLQSSCMRPKPAAIVRVEIRNSGLGLAANQGTVHAQDIGGSTNLVSDTLHLPAVNSGETKTVFIPVVTNQPYASLTGKHELEVYLEPLVVDGQPSFLEPDGPHRLALVVPEDHCR